MRRRGMGIVTLATLGPLLSLGLLVTGCGGADAPDAPEQTAPELTAARAEAVVRETFPAAEVTVQDLVAADGGFRAPAEFMGSDVTLVFERSEGAWELAAVEQEGASYTPAQLREIGATLATMRAVSDALDRYREARGELPALDDQVGLQELVPEFYPEDGELSDVWGEPLRYRVRGGEYTLVSPGPDGVPGTPDDLLIIDTPDTPGGQ